MKALPFSVNRAAPTGLADQVVDGLVSAIRSGYYEPGERLPGLLELASELGVGTQTVRTALRTLTAQGELVARRRSGITVGDRRRSWFLRHVVHLRFGMIGYYFAVKDQRLEELLSEARIRLTPVAMRAQEFNAGLPHLKLALDCQPVDLVLVDGPGDSVRSELQRRGVPYLQLGETPLPGAVGKLGFEWTTPFAALIAHAQACGVRHLMALYSGTPEGPRMHELRAAAQAGGMRFTVYASPDPTATSDDAYTMEQRGHDVMRAFLASGAPLPDLLYLADDYLARGAIVALLAAGVRVPQDLQLVTHANVGFCPVFPLALTRLEMAPRRDAEAIFHLVQAALRGEQPPPSVTLAPRLILGQTTVVRPR